MSNSNTKDKSSQYFKTFLRFRKQSMVEIAEYTGISVRTIQGYAQGKPPFRKAPATNFIAITDYMDIDPHYMLGSDNWKISEYLENILKQYNYNSLCDIAKLPDAVRLTKATRNYRARKKDERRMNKTFNKSNRIIQKGIPVKQQYDLYCPEQDVTLVVYKAQKHTEAELHTRKERLRAYIEAFKKIENGEDADITAWLL